MKVSDFYRDKDGVFKITLSQEGSDDMLFLWDMFTAHKPPDGKIDMVVSYHYVKEDIVGIVLELTPVRIQSKKP